MRSSYIAAAAFAILLVSSLHADEVKNIPSISTSGDSVVYVTPDLVMVTFGVQSFDRDLDKAKQRNDMEGEHLLAAIVTQGPKRAEIQTNNLTVELQYIDNSPWKGIQGYLVQRQYAVKLTDVKKFESLVDAALKNGANQIVGFDFQCTELRKYRDQARKMAIRAAKEKAVDLAKELDCTVGAPRMIGESSFGYMSPYSNSIQANAQNSSFSQPADGDDNAGSLPLGQIGVRATVSVTFDLATGH